MASKKDGCHSSWGRFHINIIITICYKVFIEGRNNKNWNNGIRKPGSQEIRNDGIMDNKKRTDMRIIQSFSNK